jgi:hypothetical protein
MADKKPSKITFQIDEAYITEEDFLKQFKLVLDIFNAMKNANEKQRAEMLAMVEKKMSEMENMRGQHSSEISYEMKEKEKEMMDYCKSMMAKIEKQNENEMNFIKDKVSGLKDGQDANEQRVIQKATEEVLAKIPPNKELQPETGQSIVNKVALLPEGERWLIEDVKDLRKELDEVKKRPIGTFGGGGGGFSVGAMNFHIIDDETPSEVPNGVITDFTLANTPSPSSSLKVYQDGQRMKLTTDYTLSGRTVSFVTAPLTDSIITFDYRT